MMGGSATWVLVISQTCRLLNLLSTVQMLMNPEKQSPPLSPRLIYEYANKTNIFWNIPEYRTPREYLDPLEQVRQREWRKQAKGGKDSKHRTKRGFYMDYHLQISKTIPAANAHNSQEPWSFKKEQAIAKHRSVDAKLRKGSFIDQIELEQQKRHKPGIGTYSLEKSLKQKEAIVEKMKTKKITVGEKRFYHEDTEFLAGGSPGAGNYNPHGSVRKIRVNKKAPQEWLKKHREEKEKQMKTSSVLPAPGSYAPMNCTFTTFDLIQKQGRKNAESSSLGKDARFEYTRVDKKIIKEQRPDPSSYNTMYEWKGKNAKSNRCWNEAISSGVKTLSVYH